jgi:hypothetical protein
MRVLGATLQRVGLLIVGGTLLAGFVVAAYALGDGLHRLAGGELVGEKEVFEHLILYPVAAAMAGGVAAIVGLVLIYVGDGTQSQAMP